MNEVTKSDYYLGNPFVKRDGVVQNFTKEEIIEYDKCVKDPIYFCEKYLKVIHLDKGLVPFKLYPYQKKMFHHFNDNRFSIILASRQSGKSISSVGYILWYSLFHAEKKIAILANKGGTAREMLARITLMLENIPFFLQPGCKTLNKGSILFSNNSEIRAESTSSSSIRGFSCVPDYTKVCIIDNDNNCYYTTIEKAKIINKSEFVEVNNTKKFYTVYKITNKINGKIYIGYHGTNDLNDGYMGSGKLIIRAIEKYGPENFEKEILEIFSTKTEAENFERTLEKKCFA